MTKKVYYSKAVLEYILVNPLKITWKESELQINELLKI